jgi:mono/diheme cytochrome c family protein
MTGYEIGLLSTALAFMAFALVVSLVVPRSRPAFPTPRLGAFIGVCIVFFFAQMTAVVLLAEGEAHEVAHEESEPGETTEPAPTEPAPTATETEPTETEPTETEPTVTDPDEPTETEPTETETGTTETEPTETETGTTETSPPQAGGDPVEGRNLFVTQGCGTCHTLADAGAAGTICPNLDDSAPSFELVVDRVTNGQGAMPAFGDRLSVQQIRDIAAYVSSAPSRATS